MKTSRRLRWGFTPDINRPSSNASETTKSTLKCSKHCCRTPRTFDQARLVHLRGKSFAKDGVMTRGPIAPRSIRRVRATGVNHARRLHWLANAWPDVEPVAQFLASKTGLAGL